MSECVAINAAEYTQTWSKPGRFCTERQLYFLKGWVYHVQLGAQVLKDDLYRDCTLSVCTNTKLWLYLFFIYIVHVCVYVC